MNDALVQDRRDAGGPSAEVAESLWVCLMISGLLHLLVLPLSGTTSLPMPRALREEAVQIDLTALSLPGDSASPQASRKGQQDSPAATPAPDKAEQTPAPDEEIPPPINDREKEFERWLLADGAPPGDKDDEVNRAALLADRSVATRRKGEFDPDQLGTSTLHSPEQDAPLPFAGARLGADVQGATSRSDAVPSVSKAAEDEHDSLASRYQSQLAGPRPSRIVAESTRTSRAQRGSARAPLPNSDPQPVRPPSPASPAQAPAPEQAARSDSTSRQAAPARPASLADRVGREGQAEQPPSQVAQAPARPSSERRAPSWKAPVPLDTHKRVREEIGAGAADPSSRSARPEAARHTQRAALPAPTEASSHTSDVAGPVLFSLPDAAARPLPPTPEEAQEPRDHAHTREVEINFYLDTDPTRRSPESEPTTLAALAPGADKRQESLKAAEVGPAPQEQARPGEAARAPLEGQESAPQREPNPPAERQALEVAAAAQEGQVAMLDKGQAPQPAAAPPSPPAERQVTPPSAPAPASVASLPQSGGSLRPSPTEGVGGVRGESKVPPYMTSEVLRNLSAASGMAAKELEALGSVDMQAVDSPWFDYFVKARAVVQKSWDDYGRQNPYFAAEIGRARTDMVVVITPDGKIRGATLSSTSGTPLDQAFEGVVRKCRFPKFPPGYPEVLIMHFRMELR